MKSVIWEGKPFHMAVREVPKPIIQSPTDVLVRVTTAAICGTDLHTFHGIFGGSDTPYEMGHEAIGIIEEVGEHVTKHAVGDRVVVPDANENMPSGGKTEAQDPVISYGVGDIAGTDIGGCQGRSVLQDANWTG